jgi:hypothetical protein
VVFLGPLLPICAPLLHGAKVTVALQDFGLPLHKLYTKTSRDVEWDMAVHLEAYFRTHLSATNEGRTYEPCSRVVGFERKNEIAERWKRSCITSDRIVHVQRRNVAIPHSVRLLRQDEEVVTVQMDGMWHGRCSNIVLLDHPVLPL